MTGGVTVLRGCGHRGELEVLGRRTAGRGAVAGGPGGRGADGKSVRCPGVRADGAPAVQAQGEARV